MKQREFIAALAAETGLSQAKVREVIRAAIDLIEARVLDGDAVRLSGLGTFSRSWRDGRQFRDLQTSRRRYLDGRFVLRFRPASRIRSALEGLTPQHWKNPQHQKARRVAATLLGDLTLYHTEVPDMAQDADDEAVRAACAATFGETWGSLVETYNTRVSADIRQECDHLAAEARSQFLRSEATP